MRSSPLRTEASTWQRVRIVTHNQKNPNGIHELPQLEKQIFGDRDYFRKLYRTSVLFGAPLDSGREWEYVCGGR